MTSSSLLRLTGPALAIHGGRGTGTFLRTKGRLWQRLVGISCYSISNANKYRIAENAGTTVDILIRTVYSLEQRLHDRESGGQKLEVEQ